MKKSILFLVLAFFGITASVKADPILMEQVASPQNPKDSLRLAELDRFWNELSRTVQEGDLAAYSSAYHPDAVVIFGKKTSAPIAQAIKSWQQGFVDTKSGKNKSNVTFRFTQRLGNETTALDTGIFHYTTVDKAGKNQEAYVHFEGLLVKKGDQWVLLMENQKSAATLEEWEALK